MKSFERIEQTPLQEPAVDRVSFEAVWDATLRAALIYTTSAVLIALLLVAAALSLVFRGPWR